MVDHDTDDVVAPCTGRRHDARGVDTLWDNDGGWDGPPLPQPG